jgi:hypothetical protein
MIPGAASGAAAEREGVVTRGETVLHSCNCTLDGVVRWNPPGVKLYFEGIEAPKDSASWIERSLTFSIETCARRYLGSADPSADPLADLARLIARVCREHPILQVGPCLWVYSEQAEVQAWEDAAQSRVQRQRDRSPSTYPAPPLSVISEDLVEAGLGSSFPVYVSAPRLSMRMPVMSGPRATAIIREHEATALNRQGGGGSEEKDQAG